MIQKIIGTLLIIDGAASFIIGMEDDSTLVQKYYWFKILLQTGRIARALLGAVLLTI